MTDREALRAAFAELRKRGYKTKENFQCCNTCAEEAISDQFAAEGVAWPDRKYVYFHEQEEESAFDGTDDIQAYMFLGWAGDRTEIIDALKAQGFEVAQAVEGHDKIRVMQRKTS